MEKEISLDDWVDLSEKTNIEQEWVGMPEYISNKEIYHAKILIKFRNEEDLQEFAKLVKQRLTAKTKSIWHPEKPTGINSHIRYIDEA